MVQVEFEILLLALLASYIAQTIVVWEGSKNPVLISLSFIGYAIGGVVFYAAVLLLPQLI